MRKCIRYTDASHLSETLALTDTKVHSESAFSANPVQFENGKGPVSVSVIIW